MSKITISREDADKLARQKVVLSVSGGKDSTATSLYLRELGITHSRVFADTGWEHPGTLAYISGPLQDAIGEITTLTSEGMPAMIRRKGMFPGRVFRFCTRDLKVEPILRYLREVGCDVNAIGIRADESKARGKMPEWDESGIAPGVKTWRPILQWSEQDVIDIHHRYGIFPNPLYFRGARRVGCWPCIYARKSEIRLIADESPWRIDEIRDLEAVIESMARDRYEARGETFESLGYTPPTFFSRALPGRHGTTHTPIDEVVEWAREYGQSELFAIEDEERGCLRWGMCDPGPALDAHDATERAPAVLRELEDGGRK